MSSIRVRRGTSSEWATANPVLASGEPGLDTTTGILKLGDGSTPWLTLAQIYASQASVTAMTPTAWTAFPYTAGWGPYGGYEVPGYRKVGDNVQFRGLIQASSGATGVMATLPVGFRPPTSTVLSWVHSSLTGGICRIDVSTTGAINVYTVTVGNWYAMSGMPPFSVTA